MVENKACAVINESEITNVMLYGLATYFRTHKHTYEQGKNISPSAIFMVGT